MSVIYKIICRGCGCSFERSCGIGYNGQGTLYCNRCGRARMVDFSCGWDPVPQCECGGTFDADALGCCPQCGAVLSNDDVANN
ncbi:MAG: hypothetical protein IJK07_09590 [Bacteroidales bacterium]|nr:hypothetical protein [Bacteroidales bacterium]